VLNKTPGALPPEAWGYRRCFCCTSTIHATCEDFRASADIDLEMDDADDRAGNKIVAPVHALWGAKGTVGSMWDGLATWRAKARLNGYGAQSRLRPFPAARTSEETFEDCNFFGTV
jgi:hypothetical protein